MTQTITAMPVRSYAHGGTDWQKILTHPHKLFFSMYIHHEPGLENDFLYQNNGPVPEEVVGVIFDVEGKRANVPPIIGYLQPDEPIVIKAGKLLRDAGYESFRGSIMYTAHPIEVVPDDDLPQRDFAGVWSSNRHGVHIGVGAMTQQNVTGKKEKKTYNMFCPAVVLSNDRNTIVTFFNHSTEPGYSDSVSIIPTLANLKGEKLEGPALKTGPWGTIIIDIDKVFGQKGKELLAKTGGRGSVTTIHRGHSFATLFFHVDKKTHELVSGTHTNPASMIVYSYGIKHPYLVLLAERMPFLYVFWWLKHFRESVIFTNLYPPRPLFLPNFRSYIKQGRWVLQCTYLARAIYLLLIRGFKIDKLENIDATGNLKHVVAHNLWKNFNIFHFCRARIEQLLYLIMLASPNRNGKTLSIGPRNEGEILLFWRHGFKDVTGIDLFTYSPHIQLMDAHQMKFGDNIFDTVNCGWVFAYVYDLPKVIEEIIRVSKDGAIIACSYTVPGKVHHNPAEGTNMEENNIAKVIQLFGSSVGHVYWRDDVSHGPGNKHHLVFRLKK